MTVGQIQDWIRADAVYRLACSLDFPEDVKAKVQNNREFPLSTLERLVESQPIREFLMLKADPKEVLISTAKPAAFLKAFRRVVADVATGEIDSRIANDAEGIAAYVKKIGDIRPAARSRGKFSIRDHLSQTDQPSPVLSTKTTARKTSDAVSQRFPTRLKCFCSDSRVNDIFYDFESSTWIRTPMPPRSLLRLLLEFSFPST